MSAGRMVGSLIGAFGGRALGGALGGNTGRMVGSLVGSMLGGRGARGGMGGLSGALGGLLGGDKDKAEDLPPIEDDKALIIIQAMTNAAKADGNVDQSEIDAIVERAGDLDAEEEELIRRELAAPLDLDEFIASVPGGMEADVYAASMLPIEVDTVAEAEYLRNLADGLGLTEDQVCLLYTSPSPRDKRQSRMPSSA